MLRSLKIMYEYFALYSSLTLLGLICLTWSVFALPLYFLLPRRIGTAVGAGSVAAGIESLERRVDTSDHRACGGKGGRGERQRQRDSHDLFLRSRRDLSATHLATFHFGVSFMTVPPWFTQ